MSLSLFLVPGLKTQDKSPREYFDEMKSAGAFVISLTDADGKKISVPDPGYVCFSENNSLTSDAGVFLTFEAIAYDKGYAEIISSKLNQDNRKVLAKLKEIRDRYSYASITITQRYCHPQADAIERAFAKLPETILVT